MSQSDEQDIQRFAQDWIDAEQRGDTEFLQHTLTDDFMAVGPRGYVLDKQNWLGRINSGYLKYDSLLWDEVSVRVYGDAALVIGRETQKGHFQQESIEGELRLTLMIVKAQGQWRLAGVQFSPIEGM